jgi:membrane protein implicated in regulation of membrane protease activity
MSWELIAYWICFAIGSGYAAVTAILGGFFGMAHHVGDLGIGVGHADMGHDYGGGHDATGGHGDAFAVGSDMEPVISPLSPAAISVFLATFGGVGVILTSMFHLSLFATLPASTAAGALVTGGVLVLFYHFFTKVQASSETRMAEVIGLSAEVTVPIPGHGVGEIAYICRGARLVSPARSEDGSELPRHAAVQIVRQVGSTLYVAPGRAASRATEPDEFEARD